MDAKIEIRESSTTELAVMHCTGVDALDVTFGKLYKWAEKEAITNHPEFKFVRIFHDSFRNTPPNQVRMSIGVPFNNADKSDAEIEHAKISNCKCIVGSFRIAPPDFGNAWEQLFKWMVSHNYQKANTEPFEFIYNNYQTDPEGKSTVEMYIPIL